MKCLIDADVLSYEIGSCGEYVDEDTGQVIYREPEFVCELLDQRIREIEGETWATEPSTLFLTGDNKLAKLHNRERKRQGLAEIIVLDNFRKEEAKTKVYKGNRKDVEKPFHYDNLRAYMLGKYDVFIAFGMEADDAISIELYKTHVSGKLDAIACTRDKDLRMVPGMHYGWPCGRQPSYGPKRVTELGELDISADNKKIKGNGLKFFYAQLITGDPVDNIPGLPRHGPVIAYNTLAECASEEELFNNTAALYAKKMGDNWREYFQEQANLLWMVRELDENGGLVRYVPYDER